jgi:hypothetical protein
MSVAFPIFPQAKILDDDPRQAPAQPLPRGAGWRPPSGIINTLPPNCSQSKEQDQKSPPGRDSETRLPITSNSDNGPFCLAYIDGGRYWDRASDLFGVKQDAAPTPTCRNGNPQARVGAVGRRSTPLGAVQGRSGGPVAPNLLPPIWGSGWFASAVMVPGGMRRPDRVLPK